MNKLKYDVYFLASVFLLILIGLAVWGFMNLDSGTKAIIYYNSEVIKEVDLSKDQEFVIEGKMSEMTITIKDGRISVTESGCENQICVNEGYKNSGIITCLPNEVHIKIVGDE